MTGGHQSYSYRSDSHLTGYFAKVEFSLWLAIVEDNLLNVHYMHGFYGDREKFVGAGAWSPMRRRAGSPRGCGSSFESNLQDSSHNVGI